MNTRAFAALIIQEVLVNKYSLTDALAEYKKKYIKRNNKNDSKKDNQKSNKKDNNRDIDLGLIQHISFGVLRFYPRLQFIANQFLKKPLSQKDSDILILIYIGLYQITEMRIPDHAAISETVEAARDLKKPWATKLINAVLRSYLRQKPIIDKRIEEKENKSAKENKAACAAYYAHPEWLIDLIQKSWPERMDEILTANNQLPPMSLRINLQRTTREEYIEELKKQNILAEPINNNFNCGITLHEPVDVMKLPFFEKGFVSVQDGAAQLAAPLLMLEPNLKVLDACAAPGGKTTHILEQEPNLSELVAIDISEERCNRIRENLNRMNSQSNSSSNSSSNSKTITKVITANALNPKTFWDNKPFDRILLDAPCSGTGVIRRHPDIKVLRTPKDILKLSDQQLKLMKALWPLLKSTGILLYATCSILSEENEAILEQFLKISPDAYVIPIKLSTGLALKYGIQIFPGQNNLDGFYYGRIGKK